MNIKITLTDNDYVVRAKTDISMIGQEDPFRKFLQQLKEELLPGQTAYLEIDDFKTNPVTFEISQFE
jgi:hypothetical protein